MSGSNAVAKSGAKSGAGSAELVQALVAGGELTDPDSPRGRLLNAAARLFVEKGFARTTVRDIAAEVGILSGSIFHHFRSKEAILCQVMREVTTFARARMEQAVTRERSPRGRLRACILCELEAIHGRAVPGFTILVSEWRSLSPESQKQVLRLREGYEQLWREVLADAGRMDDPALARRLLQGALSHSYNWYRPKRQGLSLDELAGQVLSLFARQGAA
ncbi:MULTISPECIES: TetR/AcrR family transcriptional regulator [unclassified Microbulbifer]|uniref:TetR/AcrR family transcriptional regulator n=1 Tax=unclassified Microbulbifer TaxID=2619833 RepID=UPI001E381930|nr:TetR/AcrR family transcriptional regulator [Microbulbifer sp. YPW16]UHQ55531.1 TetR/AcrR family transcriptional regulator [Microbulbifer sp. YPW16]